MLSAVWILSGAVILLFAAFAPTTRLNLYQVGAIYTFEAALFYVFGVLLYGRRGPENGIVFPQIEETATPDDRRGAAITYCDGAIAFYHTLYRHNVQFWRFLLTTTIVLGTIGTVLSALKTQSQVVTILRIVAVASTTIAAALNSSFRYREESVRQGAVAMELRGEINKFAVAAHPYEMPGTSTALFVLNVSEIIAVENRTWVSSMQDKSPSNSTEPGNEE